MSELKNSIFEKIKVLNKLNEEIKRNIKLLHIFRDIFNEINVILVTNEDKVYCCGSNTFGVLGFDHNKSIEEFTINEELSNKNIIDFKSSLCHTIARDCDGKLYCWGRNRYLGNGIKGYLKISKPKLHKYLISENIIDMCCGSKHTLVLTSNNEVYAWGWNDWAQIGNRDDGNNVVIPFKLNEFNGKKVKAISCGFVHSMALTESGCVYSWGNNRWGQLGLNSRNEFENKPKLIQMEVEIKKISCGYRHSLLLSREGDIYVFGRNQHKQLGLKTKGKKQLTSMKLNHSEKFIKIASHPHYNILTALSENGLYYIWQQELISESKETHFKSFDEIFIGLFDITFKTINRLETCLKNLFSLKNKKYEKNYCEINLISSGSFGIVFKAVHSFNSSKSFAVKKIPLSDDQKEKLSKESKISAKMNSNYVVQCFDFWIEENYYLKMESNSIRNVVSDSKISILGSHVLDPYKSLLLHIQMELCYKTLKEIIEIVNKELNQKESKVMSSLGYYISSDLFKELVECINYLHTRCLPIIHRDLKPANILISYGMNGRFVKLADFGLSVFHEREDQSHTQGSGTDKYMAPEVRESRNYDTKADIYSLGVITRELFNIEDHKSGNLPLKGREAIERLIEKMTAYMGSSRPTCDQILNRTEIWKMNAKQFIDRKKVNSIEESFHLYFIQKKLENYKKTNSLSDKCIIT